jgi:phosphosulfolactate phosphohydrolase-like enzyme
MDRGPITTSTLLEAEQIINIGRADHNYGHPIEDMVRVAKIASLLTGKELTAQDVTKVMQAIKLSRESVNHKRDNLIDLNGYTEILNQIEDYYAARKIDRA